MRLFSAPFLKKKKIKCLSALSQSMQNSQTEHPVIHLTLYLYQYKFNFGLILTNYYKRYTVITKS